MKIQINGEIKTFDDQISMIQVLKNFNIDPLSCVVELNGDIIDRNKLDQTLNENDQLEIIRFMGGG